MWVFFLRLEMYFHYQFGEDTTPPSFPNVPLTRNTILTTDSVDINTYILNHTEFFLTALQKTFYPGRKTIEGFALPNYERYGPATKTCLVLCAERLMEIFEIPFFRGKISRQISAYVLECTRSDIWQIPFQLAVQIDENEKAGTGLPYGLRPDLLGDEILKEELKRANDRDRNYITLPKYIQIGASGKKSDVMCPVTYEKTVGSIMRFLFFNAGDLEAIHHQSKFYHERDSRDHASLGLSDMFGYFDQPNYDLLSKASKGQAREMVRFIAKALAKAYDTEWYTILKELNQKKRKQQLKRLRSSLGDLLDTQEIQNQRNQILQEMKKDTLGRIPGTVSELRKYLDDLSINCVQTTTTTTPTTTTTTTAAVGFPNLKRIVTKSTFILCTFHKGKSSYSKLTLIF